MLVEEAHRLLSKTAPGENPSKKQSVEMFTDMLAEIRKYGESLVIVDQIPNKLTPDVLKNTNTKIIHRIFAADDKEAVGNTVMLKDEQKEFLSSLPAGCAVYFSTGTDKAIQIQIKQSTDTSQSVPTNDEIRKSVIAYYCKEFSRGLYSGLEIFPNEPTEEQFLCIEKLNWSLTAKWIKDFKANNGVRVGAECHEEISGVIRMIGIDTLIKYLRVNPANVHFAEELYKFVVRKFY